MWVNTDQHWGHCFNDFICKFFTKCTFLDPFFCKKSPRTPKFIWLLYMSNTNKICYIFEVVGKCSGNVCHYNKIKSKIECTLFAKFEKPPHFLNTPCTIFYTLFILKANHKRPSRIILPDHGSLPHIEDWKHPLGFHRFIGVRGGTVSDERMSFFYHLPCIRTTHLITPRRPEVTITDCSMVWPSTLLNNYFLRIIMMDNNFF